MDTATLVTAEELLAMQSGKYLELVRGRVVQLNAPGGPHGLIAAFVSMRLGTFVREHSLGRMFVETGFVLARSPDTVRGPDVSFLSAERFRSYTKSGYVQGAPDLTVEIRSPDDTLASLFAKATEYEAAGCELIWIIDPLKSSVWVMGAGREAVCLRAGEVLDGGTVLPGLRLAVSEVLEAGS